MNNGELAICPGVRQDEHGMLYRIGSTGPHPSQQVKVPYEPVAKLEYIPGSMASATDQLIKTEIDGTRVRI